MGKALRSTTSHHHSQHNAKELATTKYSIPKINKQSRPSFET